MVSHKSGCDFLKFTQIIIRGEKIAQEYGMIYLIVLIIYLKNLLRISQIYLCCIVGVNNFLDYNFIEVGH
ncbi:hypothetical protein CMT56_11145 [Elizabethkingia anophelis]|nr:hypothetical protein BBD30_00165 [Elizabethkingia anophelis]MDV3855545.1 hypothetical protein [Elizabethkingia anophelis]MDV3861490.1 hypothetical protein [Elizabethkingia anophelis]MDV3908515.1 hypothetical protein [Elizabethkingia anophelis]MDV3922657.1 hypothetical protein [Elizabethkingia anophelis]